MKSISNEQEQATYGKSCDECPLKGKGEIQTGVGPRDARFLVVCDSPSHHEASYGKLLPTAAMNIFGKSMMAEEFSKEDFYFYPQIRCPHDPDIYTTREKRAIQKACRPYFLEKVDEIHPEAILPLGNEASKQVFGRAVKITKVRGIPTTTDELGSTTIIPLLSPMMVVLYAQHQAVFKADCATLGRLVDNAYDTEKAGRDVLGDYAVIDDLQFLIDQKPMRIAYDTENTGLRWFAPDAAILTMQFSIKPGEAYLLPWDHPDHKQSPRAKHRLKRQLRELLCREGVEVIGQNAKYDAVYTYAQTGIRYKIGGDTLMLAAILDENSYNKGLSDLVKRHVPEMAGYCIAPETRIWKSDLTWVCADEISVGDTVVGFDESSPDTGRRKLHKADVLSVQRLRLPCYEILMSSGTKMVVSANHTWLVNGGAKAGNLLWMRTDNPYFVGKRIKRITDVVEPRSDFVGGWFSGILDGEGWTTRDKKAQRVRLGFAQKAGKVLDLAIAIAGDGMRLHNHVAGRDVHNVATTGSYASLLMLQKFRPIRLLENEHWWGISLPQEFMQDYVVSCIPVGHREVVSIKTSTSTFVAEGLASHNSDRFDATVDKSRMIDLPLDQDFIDYGCGDADSTLRLEEKLYALLEEDPKLVQYYHEVSLPGLNAFASVELRGLHIDENQVEEFEAFMEKSVGEQYESLLRQVPRSIKRKHVDKGLKFSRRDFLLDILFYHEDGFCLKPKVFTKTTSKLEGNRRVPSTSTKDHLPYFYDDCPFTYELSEYIKQERILTTNVKGFKKKYIVDSVVRPTYNLHITVTGRTSSEDPNGQNFPKRGPIAMAYRKMFVAPPDHFVLEADLSQAELRIAGDMANDPTMIGIYRSAGDIHTATALIVMGVTMEQFRTLDKKVQKDARTKAKAVNFGFLYGMGWRKFIGYAKTQYGVEFTEKEAQRIRSEFFQKYFKLPEWHAAMRNFVRERKFVRSYSGRVRHLPMIDSQDDGVRSEAERQAINAPVQEFGSTLGVISCGRINEEIEPKYLQLVGFVHDAIYAYVPKQYIEWGAKTMKYYMESNPLEELFNRKMKLPIVADVGFGVNFSEVFEMGTLDIGEDGEFGVGDYDFDKLWEEDPDSGLVIPRQRIPSHNGRAQVSIYTSPY